MKVCKHCGLKKEDNEFYKRHSKCKPCTLEIQKNYKKSDKAKSLRKLRDDNRREIINKQTREWQKNNRDKMNASRKKWRDTKQTIESKIVDKLRTRMRLALYGSIKSKTSKELIGCDESKLKEHLESKFKDGMTWENYGLYGWHIDHIIPCASFDLSKEDEQKKCFHYTNLQPLWAKENLRKSDSIIP